MIIDYCDECRFGIDECFDFFCDVFGVVEYVYCNFVIY